MTEGKIINPQGEGDVEGRDNAIKRILKPVRTKLREEPQEEENQSHKM
jgi:hypothetical protein